MTIAICTAPKRDSYHWKQSTITWEEIVGWAANPADVKECGNYLLGTLRPRTTVKHPNRDNPCTNLHRRKDFVVSRSAITLDVDFPSRGFADACELVLPYRALLHTTFQSSPDSPRYRLIIPTDREMAPDEYVTAAASVVQSLGKESFDPGTTQPERYMFRPSAQNLDWYEHRLIDGPTATVDELIAGFEEDLSLKPLPLPNRTKRDPFEIEGVIGAFNRAYREDWDLLIKTYDLPYEKVSDYRYQLVDARSQAGMGPIQETDGLVYSHHSNDPAYGRACSAFDLVRLHRFGELDEEVNPQTPVNKLPSHEAMLDLAAEDYRVTAELVGAVFAEEMEEEAVNEDWRLQLQLTPRSGKFMDVIQNWDLVSNNDPLFGKLRYNELTFSSEFTSDPPWREITRLTATVTGTDRWEFCYYIERKYGFRAAKQFVDALIDTRAAQHMYNPVRDYLESLVWDHEDRIDECLPGVKPTKFTRLVARKSMVAAVARMLDPGCKWDHTLVLYGPEGLGKSWWVDRVAKGYSSSLGPISDKDTLLTMQRSWIMLSDEGHSLKKSDHDQQKEFLTRTTDLFRLPYDREVMAHPRHCVIWSSTNDETFLRRQEGNRRFLIVHCENRVDFDALTDAYVDQLWAEAVYRYRAGERLFLDDDESRHAADERERFVEEDALGGIIEEYLDTPVPEDWWHKSRDERAQWMIDRSRGFEPAGTMYLNQTCSMQIWVEALGRRHGDASRQSLLEISTTLKRIEGWTVKPGRTRLPGYGPQVVFEREEPR